MSLFALFLIAAAEPETAIDAERAFASDAQELGQFTAFRKWAAQDARIFGPWPIPHQQYLEGREDPETSIEWWPLLSLQSCDRSEAINLGHWRHVSGAVGYFVTHWVKTDEGWRYRLDGGAPLASIPDARGKIEVLAPECDGEIGRMQPVISAEPRPHDFSSSDDGSIVYEYMLDRKTGGLYAKIRRWNGESHEPIWQHEPEAE